MKEKSAYIFYLFLVACYPTIATKCFKGQTHIGQKNTVQISNSMEIKDMYNNTVCGFQISHPMKDSSDLLEVAFTSFSNKLRCKQHASSCCAVGLTQTICICNGELCNDNVNTIYDLIARRLYVKGELEEIYNPSVFFSGSNFVRSKSKQQNVLQKLLQYFPSGIRGRSKRLSSNNQQTSYASSNSVHVRNRRAVVVLSTVVQSSTSPPTTTASPSETSMSTWMIIVICFASTLLVAFIVIGGVFFGCYIRRRRKQKQNVAATKSASPLKTDPLKNRESQLPVPAKNPVFTENGIELANWDHAKKYKYVPPTTSQVDRAMKKRDEKYAEMEKNPEAEVVLHKVFFTPQEDEEFELPDDKESEIGTDITQRTKSATSVIEPVIALNGPAKKIPLRRRRSSNSSFKLK